MFLERISGMQSYTDKNMEHLKDESTILSIEGIKEIELQTLTTAELVSLSEEISKDLKSGKLKDESIVVDGIDQIINEFWKRI